ncbi:hypothetical protein MRB53_022130 [Persea americana]|uniref:Uncharacterized protein n=1 Tax=Persea americana TaxID=3435 RepID=A0ACC2L636_PERAE|nr:hypothetical protein MRB53_022130 [Persea americana]
MNCTHGCMMLSRAWKKVYLSMLLQSYHLCKRMQPLHEWQPSLQDVVRRLDEMLFKHASSKEYMNIDTLEHRVQTLLRDFI